MTYHMEAIMSSEKLSVGARLVALLGKGRGKKKTKYGNTKVVTADGTFDSKAEYARWQDLKLLEKAGKIRDLERQVRYPLHACTPSIGGEKVGDYIADFVYLDAGNQLVVEDVKGHRTQLYAWKARHFKAEYGFEITEVKA